MTGRVLDLFAGAAGGWSLGLHRAGYRTVAACEIDDWRRAAFAAANPDARMYADVLDLTATRLMADLGYLPDVVVGSPPCQDNSAANTIRCQGVDGERGSLFFEAVRLVGEIRPSWFGFENSPRLRILGVDRIAGEMEAIGYTCWPLVVGADDILSPHQRDRLWLVGNRPDADRDRQFVESIDAKMARMVGKSGDAYRSRLEVGESIARDACEKLSPIVRAVGPLGVAFGNGPSRHFRMADGVPAGLAKKCIAAYGDAILPQISEAIGRVMAQMIPITAADIVDPVRVLERGRG